jgi:hypothetical protein
VFFVKFHHSLVLYLVVFYVLLTQIFVHLFLDVDCGDPFKLVDMNLYQMNLRALSTFLENQNQSILRYFDWFSIFLRNVMISNSIDQNACLSVNVHLIVLHTQAENERDSRLVPAQGVELVGGVPPIQIDPPLMEIRHYQHSPRFQINLISNNVCQLVVQACL